jgi:hypothetical protein
VRADSSVRDSGDLMTGRYKVGSKEDRTADNIVFDSVKEKEAYIDVFRPLMRSGIKVELQRPFPLYAANAIPSADLEFPVKICNYEADFTVTEKDGVLRVYDVKGHATDIYKLKRKWFHACYPHLRIVEL